MKKTVLLLLIVLFAFAPNALKAQEKTKENTAKVELKSPRKDR